MKRKFLAILVVLALVLGVVPGGVTLATAADTDTVQGQFEVSTDLPTSSETDESIVDGTTLSEEETDPTDYEITPEDVAGEPGDEVTDPVDGVVTPNEPTETVCSCGAEEGVHTSECPLYEDTSVVPNFDPASVYEYMQTLTDEEAALYFDGLSEAEQFALIEYKQGLNPVSEPRTITFTQAGPFLPAVSVGTARRVSRVPARATEYSALTDSNGVVTSKDVTVDEHGNYMLRLESYVTGATTTTSTTKTTPVDIVLVLDQSGSMAYNFDGKSTNTISDRRQYAMKQAVNGFIGAVNEKYSEDADHRMAIVTYGSSASTLQGWTNVDSTGVNTLQGKINGLSDSPSGATDIGAGMGQAETLMSTDYSYTGPNTTRQKVVIVFTDGVPTTRTDFDTNVANNAITYAKNLKDSGVTVYSVGIFNGADPNQLHGDKFGYAAWGDVPCDGSVGSVWGGSWLEGIVNRNDFALIDIPAGNRFLNYLSSNSSGATEIGITKGSYHPEHTVLSAGKGWKIDKNATKDKSNYYLTASDSSSLNSIFQTISENIQTGGASVTLDSTTVVRDVISDYFQLPAGVDASRIVVKTAECNTFNGDEPIWSAEQESGLTPVIEGQNVTVTGFDFSDNWVGRDTTTGAVHPGRKLILEIPIEPRDGFLGGNGVPTNGPESGIYSGDTVVENFPRPTTDVAIGEITVTAADKNVYLMSSLTEAQLIKDAMVMCGGVDITNPDNLKAWQTAYVNIAAVSNEKTDLTEDGTYSIKATVSPTTEGVATAKTGQASGNIYVFLPVLTYKDSNVYYGDIAPTDFTKNLESTEWKHRDTADTSVTMMGSAPILTQRYTPDAGKIVKGKVSTKEDIPVGVSVHIGDTDVTAITLFRHTDCAVEEDLQGGKFLLHVNTCTLTISKNGGKVNETYIFTVIKDGVEYTEFTITGNSSVTLYEMPVGKYTILEDSGWSWRYTASYSGNGTLTAENPNAALVCTNTPTTDTWLNDFSTAVKNIFGKKED